MESIMDPNWLATVIEMSITLFIFLLGVPTLIFQSFVPGELRRIYNNRIGRKYIQNLLIFAGAILIFIVAFGNHGISYILKNLLPNYYVPFANIWYLLSFIYFICIFILSVFLFLKQLDYFSKGSRSTFNLRKDILQKIEISAKDNYIKTKMFPTSDIDDLIFLGKIFEKGIRTQYLLETLNGLINFVLDNKKVKYLGNNLTRNNLFEPFRICITNGLDGASSDNIYLILEVFSTISEKLFDILMSQVNDDVSSELLVDFGDLKKIAHFTSEVGLFALQKKDNRNVKKAISNLSQIKIKLNNRVFQKSSKINKSYKTKLENVNYEITLKQYRLWKKSIESKEFGIISTIMQKLKLDDFHVREYSFLIATIVSIAFFNDVSFQVAMEKYQSLNIENKSTKLKEAGKYFKIIGDYNTVQKIRDFTDRIK